MRISYRSDRMLFEEEKETVKEGFEWLAEVQATFEADRTCGRCNNGNLHLRVRSVEKGKYYELLCLDCLSTLPFGQARNGTLFAKRRDGEGNLLSHRGWRVAYGKSEEREFEEAGKGAA